MCPHRIGHENHHKWYQIYHELEWLNQEHHPRLDRFTPWLSISRHSRERDYPSSQNNMVISCHQLVMRQMPHAIRMDLKSGTSGWATSISLGRKPIMFLKNHHVLPKHPLVPIVFACHHSPSFSYGFPPFFQASLRFSAFSKGFPPRPGLPKRLGAWRCPARRCWRCAWRRTTRRRSGSGRCRMRRRRPKASRRDGWERWMFSLGFVGGLYIMDCIYIKYIYI